MYIHHLGNQNVERLNRYGKTNAGKTNGTAAGGIDFTAQLQKAAASQKRAEETDTDSSSAVNDSNACCEQCRLNSQLITRMMTQSLYMQSGLSGLSGLTGLSTLSSSARAALAYQNMAGMLGSVFGSI